MSWEHIGASSVLWRGRCEDMIAELDKGAIDLLCTDPPWGVGFKSNQGKHAPILGDAVGEYDARHALAACAKKSRSDKHAYLIGPFAGMPLPFGKHAELYWDKGSVGMGDLNAPFSNVTEAIHFYVVASGPVSAHVHGGLSARKRQGNVLRVQRTYSAQAKRHPTEKPVALWRMLVEASSLVGETVCDPYMGVGGCGVAAILAGRNFIGAELDPGFFEIAKARIIAAEAWAQKAAGI